MTVKSAPNLQNFVAVQRRTIVERVRRLERGSAKSIEADVERGVDVLPRHFAATEMAVDGQLAGTERLEPFDADLGRG